MGINTTQNFKQGDYKVKVKEIDTVSSDDEYEFGDIKISLNDLMKLKNGESLRKESGDYYIEIWRE